jgi:hypothetical protein
LSCLELHFQAVCPDLCESLASLAPGITRLELSLDLAFELTTKQVCLLMDAAKVKKTVIWAPALPNSNQAEQKVLRTAQGLRNRHPVSIYYERHHVYLMTVCRQGALQLCSAYPTSAACGLTLT